MEPEKPKEEFKDTAETIKENMEKDKPKETTKDNFNKGADLAFEGSILAEKAVKDFLRNNWPTIIIVIAMGLIGFVIGATFMKYQCQSFIESTLTAANNLKIF